MSSAIVHLPAAEVARRRKYWGLVALAGVALILIPPLVGLSGTAMTLVRAFTEVSSQAAVHREMTVSDVSGSLRLTMFGLTASSVGCVILLLAMVRRGRLEKPGKPCT